MRDQAHDHAGLWADMQENARAVRGTEHGLARSTELKPYLEHAANVMRLTDSLRVIALPIKATFSAARLNYQLARQAVTLAETVERFEERLPVIRSVGPSLVLLLNEAERRFEREERAQELPELLHDLSNGMSRRGLREKYLPPRRSATAAVFAALQAGRVGDAKRAFEQCDPVESGRLRRFASMLASITGAMQVAAIAQTGSTIDEALMTLVKPSNDGVAPCNSDESTNGG